MMQWFRNGWEHKGTTAAGMILAGLHLYQTYAAQNSFLVAGMILILGWVTTHPTIGK